MSYPSEARPNKLPYLKTLPDRIAQSPTGIAKIPNSRFPTMAPLNPATYKSVYERAGFDVYRPQPKESHKSAPSTPTVQSGLRSASVSHIPSSQKTKVQSQKRNASEHFSLPQPQSTGSAPPVPHLKIDAILANRTAQTGFGTQPAKSAPSIPSGSPQTSRSMTTIPNTKVQALPSSQSGATTAITVTTASSPTSINSQRTGYSYNTSDKLPQLNNTEPSRTEPSNRSPLYESNAQRSIPASASSSTFDINSQRNMPQNGTSSRYDMNSQRAIPQSATSSRFNFSQQSIPQSATSSKFDTQSSSTNSSGFRDGESVYMSTQSFQNTGSNSSFADGGKGTRLQTSNGKPQISSGTSQQIQQRSTRNPYSRNQSIDNFKSTPAQSINPISTGAATSLTNLNNVTPTSRAFPPSINSNNSNTSQQSNGSMGAAGDDSYAHINQSSGTVKYEPQSVRTITADSKSDDEDEDDVASSDDELNLSSEDESDDESMKSAILSPDPQSRRSEPPSLQEVAQLQKEAAAAASPLPPMPPQHTAVPSFMVSDPEGNITQHGNALSPTTVAKQLESRFSTRSSVYGSEDFSSERRYVSESPVTSGGFDDLPNLMEDNGYDNNGYDNYENHKEFEASNANAFEEVETELENLTMNSTHEHSKHSFDFTNDQTHLYSTERQIPIPEIAPLQIKVHSVKESTTDSESIDHRSHSDQGSWVATPPLSQGDPFKNPLPEASRSIPNSSESVDNHNVEPLQFQHREPPKPKFPPGEGPCRKCDLEIPSKPIYSKSGELSGQWHRPCFTCTLCDTRFNKNISCFVLNDEPYCEFHYHLTNNSLCQVCGHGIVGKCLENDTQDRYHVDCLKCTICSTQITGDYTSVNGRVHCESCAAAYTSQAGGLGVGLSSNIEKRRTRLYFI